MQPWQAANALMPGEHNYQQGKPMPGQVPPAVPQQMQPAQQMMQPPQSEPAKRGGFLGAAGNALGAVMKFGAPEAYEQGRQEKLNRNLGNALAEGNYEQGAQEQLRAGNIEQGLAAREMGQAQSAEQRKAEAQGVLQLFTTLQPEQVTQYAMEDPAGFERMTGMSSDEYMQAGARMQQMGIPPAKFAEMVVSKAQAELGMEAKQTKYGLDLKEVMGPDGKPMLVQASEAGGVRPVEGMAPVPEAPDTPNYDTWEDGNRRMTGILGQPDTYQEIGTVYRKPEGGDGSGADEYGLAIQWGYDAEGNPVPMQASKSGGLSRSQLPEGVTPLDPYGRSYDTAMGKNDAKKAAYQTTEGLKVQAAEEDFARFSAQIDSAIEKTDKGNTGFLGQFKPSPDLDGLLETIEAGTAFTSLVELKAQGGTLGALSETELDLLKSKIANVRRSQSQEQLDANLEILKLTMENSMRRVKQAYEMEYESGRYGNPRQRSAPPAAGGQGAVGPSGQPVPEGFE